MGGFRMSQKGQTYSMLVELRNFYNILNFLNCNKFNFKYLTCTLKELVSLKLNMKLYFGVWWKFYDKVESYNKEVNQKENKIDHFL